MKVQHAICWYRAISIRAPRAVIVTHGMNRGMNHGMNRGMNHGMGIRLLTAAIQENPPTLGPVVAAQQRTLRAA